MKAKKFNVNELEDKRTEEHEVSSLKGTIFSVGVVGAVILFTYLLLFGLYMARV